MPSYPHTHLFHGDNKTVAISGPHIQLLDSKSGELLCSTASFEGTELDSLTKAGPVRCAAIDSTYTHLATAGDDKLLKIWAIDGLQLLSERELPKKPTQIRFTRSARTIVVADKFGDVFSYPLTPQATTTPVAQQQTESGIPASHENPSGGTLILGHTSLLTDFLLTPDELHIITADRDEHIRVSWFPQGHTIESFCLGHKKFISAIHIPRDPAAHGILVSGGGDPVLKVWQWHTGRCLYNVAIEEAVRSFITVRRSQPKRGYDSDGEHKPPTRRWLARQRRRQAKATALVATVRLTPSEDTDAVPDAQEAEGLELEAADEDEDEEEKDENGDDAVEEGAAPATSPGGLKGPLAAVLVVQKIETLKFDERLVVVFSAVGATALFWFPLPSAPTAVSDEVLVVHAHDFGCPIVTFALISESLGCVWVSLDAHWNNEGSSPDVLPHVRQASEVSPPPSLLSTLNGLSVISADEREFSKLQLYEPLTSLPKNIDATHDPMIRNTPDSDEANAKGSRSAKAAGKMRTRMALLARGVQDEPRAKKAKGEGTGERDDAMDES
ncbi:WD40-repeat-containing domain protein [Russula dissimulans]|nr:WD40-repeat-containing domain protein [Russula dissimulans]